MKCLVAPSFQFCDATEKKNCNFKLDLSSHGSENYFSWLQVRTRCVRFEPNHFDSELTISADGWPAMQCVWCLTYCDIIMVLIIANATRRKRPRIVLGSRSFRHVEQKKSEDPKRLSFGLWLFTGWWRAFWKLCAISFAYASANLGGCTSASVVARWPLSMRAAANAEQIHTRSCPVKASV